MWELRTAELAFRLGDDAGVADAGWPLLVCPTRGGCLASARTPLVDPVFAGLRSSWAPVADLLRAEGCPPLLLLPREAQLRAALASLQGRVSAVYLPPPLHLGLHWLGREMAQRGTLPQAHLLSLAARLGGWLRALPRMQRTAGGEPEDSAIGELGRRLQRELVRQFASKLTLDELAGQLGAGRAQLNRALRRLNGFSVARFRTELRLRHAATLLLDGEPHCAAAARQVGYASPGQFSLEFGRLYGAPPSRLATLLEASIGLGNGVA